MLRVIVDANVWTSALLNPGNAATILEHLKRGSFIAFYPDQLLKDFESVARRPWFAKRIRREDLDQLLELIQKQGVFIDLHDVPVVSRDTKDDAYLACAVAASCDFIVSGDRDLLVLIQHKNTKMVTPRQFLDILTSEQEVSDDR